MMKRWITGPWRWLPRRRERREDRERGEYSFRLIVWDGKGKPFGGVGHVEPKMFRRVMEDLAATVADIAETPEMQEELGWTAPTPSGGGE